jgi:hypothetical protein
VGRSVGHGIRKAACATVCSRLTAGKGKGLAEVADRKGSAGVSDPLSESSAARASLTALLRGYGQVFLLLDSTPAVV